MSRLPIATTLLASLLTTNVSAQFAVEWQPGVVSATQSEDIIEYPEGWAGAISEEVLRRDWSYILFAVPSNWGDVRFRVHLRESDGVALDDIRLRVELFGRNPDDMGARDNWCDVTFDVPLEPDVDFNLGPLATITDCDDLDGYVFTHRDRLVMLRLSWRGDGQVYVWGGKP